MSDTIACSVVIPTYNRKEGLRECLESIVKQTAASFEVIVVDDCSVPATLARDIVEKIMCEHPHIPYQCVRREKNGGHGAARNTGVAIARGSLILFTDDDCILPNNWIETHEDAHRRYPEAAGVGGWYWSRKSEKEKNAYDRFFEQQFTITYPNMRETEVWTSTMHSPSGNTANMSYKADVFRALKGFDETIYFTGGIDWELKARMIALGHSLVSIPFSITHTKEFTFKTFFSKAIKLGRGVDYMARKYPSLWKPSLYLAIRKYASWKTHPDLEAKEAYLAFWWVIALIVGKWWNRIRRFSPKETFKMRSENYFTYRYQDGQRITMHEMHAFNPHASEAAFVQATHGATTPLCSVVIPTYNRKAYVLDAAQAVLAQENIASHLYELIVVDDGSSDGTKEAIEELQALHPERAITYIYQENKGAARARNAGAEKARGDIIFFTDSDCQVQPKWLWGTLQAYEQHPDIVGTGGGVLTWKRDSTMLDWYRNFFADNRFVARYRTTLVKSNDTERGVTAYDSANLSIRREIFHRVGGFFPVGKKDVGYYHEDVDFAYRVQKEAGPMALVPNTFVLNQRLLSLRDFCTAAYVRGATLPALSSRLAQGAIAIRERPLPILVLLRLFQCLTHPFTSYYWADFLYFYAYSRGFKDGSLKQHARFESIH